MSYHPHRIDTNCDFRTLARQSLEACLKKTAAGGGHLHVPALKGHLRPAPKKHFHLMPELFLQLEGVNHFDLPHERFRLLPGELCIIPRGMPHWETVRLRHGRFALFAFQYNNMQGLRFLLANGKQGQHPTPIKYTTIPCQRILRLAEYLEDIVQISQADPPLKARIIRWLLNVHLAELITILKTAPDVSPENEEPFKITRVKQLIQIHANEPKLNVSKLAEMMLCSADYLSHLFHSRTGVTLSVYINHYRITQAKYLLQNTTMNIKEIAHAVGYTNPDYFGQLFRAVTGQAPARYRQLYVSKNHFSIT